MYIISVYRHNTANSSLYQEEIEGIQRGNLPGWLIIKVGAPFPGKPTLCLEDCGGIKVGGCFLEIGHWIVVG